MGGAMTLITLPRRSKGRPSTNQKEAFEKELDNWCAVIQQINSTLDFRVSSRGWCYILEEKCGLLKGDFDTAQKIINDCRKSGKLPLDICDHDDGRGADGALVEFERSLIRERTRAGLAVARRVGRAGGRPQKLTEGEQTFKASPAREAAATSIRRVGLLV